MGSLYIHGFIIAGIMVATFIAYLFLQLFKVGLGFYNKHKYIVFYNIAIRYFIEGYLVLSLSCLLNLE